MNILLAEDDGALAEVIAQNLQMLGNSVLVVASLTAAKRIDPSVAMDVVISDVGLAGGESGIDLLGWARDRFPGALCILTSGVGRPHGVNLMDSASQAFLAKPFDIKDLFATINSMKQKKR